MSTTLWLAVLLVAVVPLLVLLFSLRHLARRHGPAVVPAAGESADALARACPCPRCGQPMQPGFVMAGRGVLWRAAGSAPFSPFTTIFGALENTLSLSFRPGENRAWRCAACRIVTIDHARLLAGDR